MIQFLSIVAVLTFGDMVIIQPSGGAPKIVTNMETYQQCQQLVSAPPPNASRIARDAHGDAIIACVRAVERMIQSARK